MAFFGVGQAVWAHCAVGEVYAVEGLGEGVKGLLAAVGLELTFPYGDAVPAHGGNFVLLFDVTLFVATYFLFPEVGVGLWHFETLAVVVSVPEAAVDEDDCAVFAKYDVGMSRKPWMVETVAEAAGKEIPAHQHLRARSFAFYGCHAAVPLLLCHLVHRRILPQSYGISMRLQNVFGYYFFVVWELW